MKYPIETSRAGSSISCSCGEVIVIPTMLKIKKLPLWQSEEEIAASSAPESQNTQAAADKSASSGSDMLSSSNGPASAARSNEKIPVLAGNRLGVFIVGLLLTALFGWFAWSTWSTPPHPTLVFGKRTQFAAGDNVVRRNSTPVEQTDIDFYLYQDPRQGGMTYIINDLIIDRVMSPFELYNYFDNFKHGIELSENFHENFSELKNNWLIMTTAAFIALFLSCCLCLVPWFMPRKKKVVGDIRGATWTK